MGLIFVYLGAGCLLLSSLSVNDAQCPFYLRWMAWLGRNSYSVYLWHILVGSCLFPLVDWKANTAVAHVYDAFAYFALSWIFGVAMARLIEFPVLKLRDRWYPSATRQLPA